MTNRTNSEYRIQGSFSEHLTFVALLLPTFFVLAAAVVSLATPDSTAMIERPMITADACTCTSADGDDGP